MLSRFEQRGFKIVGLKMVQPSRKLAECHYEEHRGKPFFERACVFLCSGPVVATVVEGRGVIAAARKMIGSTDPMDAVPGTIRFDFGAHWRRNLIHGSDSPESAAREIALWFQPEEILAWDHTIAPHVYELPTSKIIFEDA